MFDNYCPICAEWIRDEPFCSSCGEVAGSEPEAYKLHTRDYYIEKQIKMFGKVIVEPVNFLPLDN